MRIYYTHHERYYRCATKYLSKELCQGSYISEAVLHNAVLEEIRKLYMEYVDEKSAAKHLVLANDPGARLEKISEEIEKARHEQKMLDKRLQALYIDKLDGLIDAEEFTSLKKSFKDEKARLEENTEKKQREINDILLRQKKARGREDLIRSFKDIQKLDARTVEMLIDHVEIGGNRNKRIVNIYWNI